MKIQVIVVEDDEECDRRDAHEQQHPAGGDVLPQRRPPLWHLFQGHSSASSRSLRRSIATRLLVNLTID